MYRENISLINDMKIRKCSEEKVFQLVDVGAQNHFKDGVIKASDEVKEKMERKSKGDTWWWNEEVNKAVSRRIWKKDAHQAMHRNSTEENKEE